MKKTIFWVLRICCLVVIAFAVVTVSRCVMHRNDDHSYETVMGRSPITADALDTDDTAETWAEISVQVTAQDLLDTSADENPTVALSADGSITANRSSITVTASFRSIENNIQARLLWYVDGVLTYEEENRLLVEGSTATCSVQENVEQVAADEIAVRLVVEFGGKSIEAAMAIPVEHPSEENVRIQTEEITVTCQEPCTVYEDSSLYTETGMTLESGDTGLLLTYEKTDAGTMLNLQFPDGSTGWVRGEAGVITDENCTTDADYTDAQKEEFINSMQYQSDTMYLVWVSLYTQRVNVFTGYQGNWTLIESFLCASGSNQTPTTTGIYTVSSVVNRWDLGEMYVSPVMVFNGGEAFTSQPYDVSTGEIANDTIGQPASGGSVWMAEDDIAWMVENLTIGSLVVVY